MRLRSLAVSALLLLHALDSVFAQVRQSGPYAITSESIGGSGGRVVYNTSTSTYAIAEAVSASTTTTSTSARYAFNGGYVGQFPNVVGFVTDSGSTSVSELSAVDMRGYLLLSDATRERVDGSQIVWSIQGGPLQRNALSGQLRTDAVFADTTAQISGAFAGFAATSSILVRDTIPDNFGSYANDGLPDDWQVYYFGQNNPLALPSADASGTGQSNLFKYLAGLNPLDPNARFTVETDSDSAGARTVTFGPVVNGRDYIVEFISDPASGVWTPLPSASLSISDGRGVVIDSAPSATQRLFRVRISLRP